MIDPIENIRRKLVHDVNAAVQSEDELAERARLEALHGKVWNTEEASADFDFLSFLAPFAMVVERTTGKRGLLTFQDYPRFYFDFVEK